ncbi:hypothetical protein GIB67_019382 [Kingdonia uniflora]|uniref:Uncharacterized protein n=1 Tax=Kingdonia uniflora TaxID=39325 RepID=A0A7J7M1U9_9MAGN|nr:hypothetical protein GIB67_019382 [Kingdonia uniflora]
MNQMRRMKGLFVLFRICGVSWLFQLKTLTNKNHWIEESVNSRSIKPLLILRLILR